MNTIYSSIPSMSRVSTPQVRAQHPQEKMIVPPKLKKEAQAFEANVLQEELKPMFAFDNNLTIKDPSGMFSKSYAEKMYQSLLTEQYSKDIAQQGGIGIAGMIEKELMHKKI